MGVVLPTVPGLIALLWMAQAPAAGGAPAQAACQVTGTVRADATPLPGVAITVRAGDVAVAASSTGESGAFRVRLPQAGAFTLHAELSAFAAISRDITLEAGDCRAQIDLTMTLASRAPKSPVATAPAATSTQAASATPAPPGAPSAARPPVAAAAAGRQASGAGARAGGANGRRFQALGLQADATGAALQGDETNQGTDRETASLPAGFSTDVATESVTTVGAGGQLNNSLLAERFAGRNPGDFGADNGAFRADGGVGPAQAGGRGGQGGAGGGFGGGGFGGGGFGGGGFGGPGGFAFGGRMRNEQIRGQLSTTIADSALDAAPVLVDRRAH